MLTQDAKRNADSYSYPNGMLNTAWIAGVLRLPPDGSRDGLCFIQQTRNENHMLPIEYDPKSCPLPRELKDLDLVMAYCHVHGGRDGDQRIVRLKSIRFEAANVMHMDKNFGKALLAKWALHVHEAAKDSGMPASMQALSDAHGGVLDTAARLDSFDWAAMKMNQNAANTVKLAGFIEAKSLEQNRVSAEGKPMNDRMIILLRQTADPDSSIAIRWYSRNLAPLFDLLKRKMPIQVVGEFRLDVKANGPVDPVTKLAPVTKIPFIQAKDMPTPVQPGSDAIRVIPYWVQDMMKATSQQDETVSAAAPVVKDNAAAQAFAASFDAGKGGANG